jgi:hypothetical protein
MGPSSALTARWKSPNRPIDFAISSAFLCFAPIHRYNRQDERFEPDECDVQIGAWSGKPSLF